MSRAVSRRAARPRALGLEHEHANGRRQVGAPARGVDHRREGIEGQPALGRDRLYPSPERILERDTRSMSGDDERTLGDAGVRNASLSFRVTARRRANESILSIFNGLGRD